MRWLPTIMLLLFACGHREPGPPVFARRLAYEAALADGSDRRGPRSVFGSVGKTAAALDRGSRLQSTGCPGGWLFRLRIDELPGRSFFLLVPRTGDAGFALAPGDIPRTRRWRRCTARQYRH